MNEDIDLVNAVVLANPGTEYAYRPTTAEIERTRRQRYARMVALETLRLFKVNSSVPGEKRAKEFDNQ